MIGLIQLIIEAIGVAAVAFAGFVAFHADLSRVIGAFIVGYLGSIAYVSALYFKFVGSDDRNRSIILKPFCADTGRISLRKSMWYGFMGGAIAAVFQYSVPEFVAIQSLILGITWPMIVAQFLSGRLSSPTKEEEKEEKLIEKVEKGSTVKSQNTKDIEAAIKSIQTKIKQKRRTKGKAG